MKVFRYTLFLVFLCAINVGKCEVVPTKMHRLLFGSALIVKAKIVSHTDHDYKIQIIEIYRDRGMGIKVGDHIKIKKEMNVISSSETVDRASIEARSTGVAFLVKSERGWHVLKFPFFQKNNVTLRFDYEYCRIHGTSAEIKAQVREYFQEFKLVEEKLVGNKTEKEVHRSDLGQLALIQYYQMYRFSDSSKLKDRIHCGLEAVEEVPQPKDSSTGQ